ncbi:MAG: dihydropteroate synthase [Desulfovibrionales bacterium]|nr:dihydropteroate synthase [Desulfovibrionales bacterium]
MRDFRRTLRDATILIFDGGMGSLLQRRGLKPGQSPEQFGMTHPEVVATIHKEYIQAGARVITTNTFGATSYKLPRDLGVFETNETMARIARQAAGGNALVAGSVGPTGRMVAPLGDVSFRELVDVFKEQIKGLLSGGVDLILGETHYDLAEARAVVVAAREVCDLPVGISMTFEGGLSLTGTTPEVFALTMGNMGIDLLASNCSAGPEELVLVARAMLRVTDIPVLIEPNAGLPELVDGATVFRLPPDPFASAVAVLAAEGVSCLGGCCGTTPDHIRALAATCSGKSVYRREAPGKPCPVVTSRTMSVEVGFDSPCRLIGERINPTGKPALTEELQRFETRRIISLAEEQVVQGADLLDVNVGAPMVDEARMLPLAVTALTRALSTPLCLDSISVEAIRAGLEAYPGSALVNSISGEAERMDLLGALCRDYGAPFILLPIKGRNLPVTAPERLAIIEELLIKAESLRIPRRLILVDALALTVSSKPEAARACLEVIRHCRDKWGLASTVGLSNISFGLPARDLVNSTFLAMAMGAGITTFIANPNAGRIQESLAAAEVLLGRDRQAAHFISVYAGWTPDAGPDLPAVQKCDEEGGPVAVAVIKGHKDRIAELLRERLDAGVDPFTLVDTEMIPAIAKVGEKYEKREYFLPQLLLCAETMQVGFDSIKHLLQRDGAHARDTIIMATVEGDIHDIGKNIVCLMLKNFGYTVVDLGKDVRAADIVDAAVRHKASVIGLSALMTTTMVHMEDTVRLVREQGLDCRIMVGGAVVSQAYADLIGAHGYADDAVAAVRVATKLCSEVAGHRS